MSDRYMDKRNGHKDYQHHDRKSRDQIRSRSRSRSRSSTTSSSSSASRSPERSRHQDKHRSKQSKSSQLDRRREDNPRNRHRDYSDDSNSGSNSNRDRNGKSNCDPKKDYKVEAEEGARCPPPPIISKVSMSFGKPTKPAKPIQMKLSTAKPSDTVKKLTVASAFGNNDSDDEVEEMPAECKMRMRNIGRDTPTSSGPNSFGKTKQGFCDSKKMFEKTLREICYD